MSQSGMTGNLAQPRTQFLRLTQIVKFAPGREERLLGCVLARREIAENSQRDAAHHRLVSRDDFNEGAFVAEPRGAHQFGVRRGTAAAVCTLCVRPLTRLSPEIHACRSVD